VKEAILVLTGRYDIFLIHFVLNVCLIKIAITTFFFCVDPDLF